MSAATLPGGTRRPEWLASRAPWAGLAIVSMWLAVLFVGVFGGDIVTINGTAGAGNSSTVPAAVALALFALIATIFVARWGFGGGSSKQDGSR
jgi:hypothetical protein